MMKPQLLQSRSYSRLLPFMLLGLFFLFTTGSPLFGAGSGEHGDAAGHVDPVAIVLFEILIILVLARMGGFIAEKLGQPGVLGELMVGVLFGSLSLLSLNESSSIMQVITNARTEGSHLDILARIGVVILLFQVGLETKLSDLMKVGMAAFVVAVTGVIFPFAFGWIVSSLFISAVPAGAEPWHVHLFLGATLCATSVGITARVFKDLNQLDRRESRIVLGAAVIDDVLGLIILAVVAGIITGSKSGADTNVVMLAGVVSLKAFAFLLGAILVGVYALQPIFRVLSGFRDDRMLLVVALVLCFLLSFIANSVGLATIVGAFAAGLILEEANLKSFAFDKSYEEATEALHHMISPIAALFVPIFFIQMGMQVKLETFLNTEVLILALALTLCAIFGKMACALAVSGTFWQRMCVGIGMNPRGEVGLIFANIGLALGVVTPGDFTAIVIMVVLTTFVTPPLMKICLAKVVAEETKALANG